MDHDEIMRRRKKILTTSMSTPEVQTLRAMHRRSAPNGAEADVHDVVWLTRHEAAARVAAGARMLRGNDHGSPSFDPCQHSWLDFVDGLRDDAGRYWDDDDRHRLEPLRRSVLDEGIRLSGVEYEVGLHDGDLLVPLIDGVLVTFTRDAWASLMAAAWSSDGEFSRHDDWHGDIRIADPVPTHGVGLFVEQVDGVLSVFVVQCDETPGEGEILLLRRPRGLNRTASEMCLVEYLADTPISAAVSAEEWSSVVRLALQAWRVSHRAKAGDSAMPVVLDGGRATA